MKKSLMPRFVLLFLISLSLSIFAEAQFVVKVRPGAPRVRVRPAMPSPRHIWVGGEYVWRGGQYVYTDGYWATPPRSGYRWVEGRWKHNRRGWVWVPGHWR
ncbi:MAG: YXWGXW repeat-containing protein [Chitinophagaceae bacterium]|nr:YXWGXW repeat-containing protein [Chitinophagaceae bacterium]MBL0056038.1 YXWGXW repeat-containing protein [Chitinophagaceae bacterium]